MFWIINKRVVYVARQEVVLMQRIVRWLNSQRLYDGGWASTQVSFNIIPIFAVLLSILRTSQTSNSIIAPCIFFIQDTAAAMKALIDFTIRSNIRNVTHLTVTIEAVARPDVVTTFRINADQLSTRQVLKVSWIKCSI